jgi:peptide-methionine (R)-S-oxide reductase
MNTRRQFLFVTATAAGLTPLVSWLSSPAVANGAPAAAETFPIQKTDAEWRASLTKQQYQVLRKGDTERAGSSPLDREKRRGTFVCAGCAHPLFSSSTKFESGTGWPSFYAPLEAGVATSVDRSFFMVRTEVHCAQCGGHLGHVFPDGPRPTGLRYCMNGLAMTFVPA